MVGSNSIKALCLSDTDENGQALLNFLRSISGLSLVEHATSADAVLQALKQEQFDVVILDLCLKTMSAFYLTSQIRQEHPTVRVLVCTASCTPEEIFAAMDAGADGYVLKGNSNGLESAIRSVKLGTVWLDPGIAKQILEVIVNTSWVQSRTLPTGLMVLPLLPKERELLDEVAGSNCVDGVCMIDPSFLKKLKRYAPGPNC